MPALPSIYIDDATDKALVNVFLQFVLLSRVQDLTEQNRTECTAFGMHCTGTWIDVTKFAIFCTTQKSETMWDWGHGLFVKKMQIPSS